MFLIAGGLIGVLLLGAGGVIWISNSRVLDAHHRTEEASHDAAAAREIQSALNIQRALQDEFAITADAELLESFHTSVVDATAQLETVVEHRTDDPVVAAAADQIRVLEPEYEAIVLNQMAPAFAAGDTETGLVFFEEAQETLAELLTVAQELVDHLDAETAASAASVGREINQGQMAAAGVVAVLLAVVLGGLVALYSALLHRFRKTVRTLETVRVASTAADQTVRDHMADTSHEVDRIAEACDEATTEVSLISQSIDELTAAIEEISSSSSHASSVANEAVHRAEETNETVTQLGASSAEIGQVIEVITSIAKQTNLLALNATIEAARAGESGKGFAVVANEVKELAKQTAASTEQIAQIVTGIQHGTGESVHAIETIQAIVKEIASNQTAVAASVEEQAALTSKMNTKVGVVNQSIGTLSTRSEGLKTNSATLTTLVEESSQRSGQLESVADDLQRTIGQRVGATI
ncbi:MAG: methyl-accepting chemotaxis protein [Actinomycetota bacterium]